MIYLVEIKNELKGFYLKKSRDAALVGGAEIIQRGKAEKKHGAMAVSLAIADALNNKWKELK